MKNNIPKISIIIPIHNGEKYIRACLSSLLKQDYYNYEIILVDNNSTDNTKKIIKEISAKQKKIIYTFAPIKGRGRARNCGLEKATGEIIAMTDIDCIVPKNWLIEISQPIIYKKAEAVMGFQTDAISNYFSRIRQQEDWLYLQKKIEGNYINHLDTKNFAIKAKIIKRLKFDNQLTAYEDWDLFIRLKKENIKILFKPKLLVKHYHDSSIKELYKTQKERGNNLAKIIYKYKNNPSFKSIINKDESGKSMSLKNFIFFIPWTIWQLIINPDKALYKIIADFSWKIGIISHLILKNLNKHH